jgi:DNA processing protein
MNLNEPRFAPRDEVFAERSRRPENVRFAGLWLAGSLRGLAGVTVAVVGSRAPSHAAARRAQELGRELARAGACVISGLALGIDGSAHAGALAGEGTTLGVLGGGHRRFFPRRNLELAREMLAAGGGVLSPYPPDEPARRWQFLERNGVVAALADAVVIVEAAERSGALNTASWASDLGIDVMVYPGDVDHPKAAGCNSLIRDGATLVRHPADVLGALGLQTPPAVASSGSRTRVAPLESALEHALARGPAEFETLVEGLRAPPGELLALLVRLELAGRVERRGLSFASARTRAPG